MKPSLLLYLAALIPQCMMGQVADSVTEDSRSGDYALSGFKYQANENSGGLRFPAGSRGWLIKGSITFATNGLQMTPLENEILALEDRECKALLKRDTAALKNIWLRDFTLDAPQNKLLTSNNPIPYYISFGRMIEKFNLIDNKVYTSGYEFFQQLDADGKLKDPVKRSYFHVWIMRNAGWRLAMKTNN